MRSFREEFEILYGSPSTALSEIAESKSGWPATVRYRKREKVRKLAMA
jgi:hypothetical protein